MFVSGEGVSDVRVMGVDPGLTRCGMALVETAAGRAVHALDVDVVRTHTELPVEQRLAEVFDAATEWLSVHTPDFVAIERVFARREVSTVMGTAQASGVVALAAAQRGVPVAFYTPTEVKAAISGNGRADKKQMIHMVTRILGLQKPPSPADAADALALAICHSWRAPMAAKVGSGTLSGRSAQAAGAIAATKAGYEAKVAAALAKQAAGQTRGPAGQTRGPAAADTRRSGR